MKNQDYAFESMPTTLEGLRDVMQKALDLGGTTNSTEDLIKVLQSYIDSGYELVKVQSGKGSRDGL